MTSASSLRDLYASSSSSWSFESSASANGTQPSMSAPEPAAADYQWSPRPARNSIYELTPSLDLNDPVNVKMSILFKGIVASVFLQYGSTAIAMPWEVGKMLLQVQWVPRDAEEVDVAKAEEQFVQEEEELSESSFEDDSYFADPHSDAGPSRHSRHREPTVVMKQHTSTDDSTESEYIIPVGSASGVWGMIKRIGRFRGEGWLALEKGLLTSCIHDILSSTLQPMVHYSLQSLLAPVVPIHQTHFLIPVASHVFTAFVLSPLDLIRTRLIVQSSLPQHRTYSGPLDALSQILRHEGGWNGIYMHPHLLIPTLIDNTLRSLISLALPSILTGYLGAAHISEDSHPVLWGFTEFIASCGGLLLTLPFETIRRRLQVQVRGSAKPLKTCVATRPAPYNGIVDTFWHVLTEERSDLPLHAKKRTHRRRPSLKGKERAFELARDDDESWGKQSGLGQLYRGFGMRLGASAIVFLLGALTGPEDTDAGWAEI